MALNNIYSLTENTNGIALTSGSGSAWAVSNYVEMTSGLSIPIAIIGFSYIIQGNAGAAANLGSLLELAIGQSGLEIIKIQLPSSVRTQSVAGYNQQCIHNINLPEPYIITENTRISIRGSVSDATGGISFGNVKIFYYEKSRKINTNFLAFFNN
jgi:hypothetical protein